MVIVLIRRCVKDDKEAEFLDSYNSEHPTHPGFIGEYLTKVSSENLPESMRNLPIACDGCVTYINVAMWQNAASFIEHFKPERTHDPRFECEDRLRIVLEVVRS